MSGALFICNRQRALPINVAWLRRLTKTLLRELCGHQDFNLGICFVRANEMACLNQTFLGHEGPTDVVTFDYSEARGQGGCRPGKPDKTAGPRSRALHGEIVVCANEVASQARRFGTTWQSELARYVIHGVLHLEGYDDLRPAARRRMKREEDRLLRALGRRFALRKLARKTRFAA